MTLLSRTPTDGSAGVTLDLAEAAWADQRLTIDAAYLNTLALDYGTGVHVLDIADSPDSAAATINDWAATETQQHIQNLQPMGSITNETRLVLVNATYFSGQWQTQFNPSVTQQAPFTRLDGSKVQVPMMIAPNSADASMGDGYVAVELPYVGSFVSMVMVMPDASSFASVEAGLTGDFVMGVFKALGATDVQLDMPRFKVTGTSLDIGMALQALGMTDAFNPNMNGFSPALVDPEGPVHIEHVFHDAFISVDENGTQAAAATAVDIDVDGGVSLQPPTTITLNHPFFFFLRDIPTNAVLFAGRVMDPSL